MTDPHPMLSDPTGEAVASTGPQRFVERMCSHFDALLSMDHRAAREASEQYDEAFHCAVHALDDLRKFGAQIGQRWAAPRSPSTGTRPTRELDACDWTYDDDGFWRTSCSDKVWFFDGTPDENNAKFCPFCGKPLFAPPPPESR